MGRRRRLCGWTFPTAGVTHLAGSECVKGNTTNIKLGSFRKIRFRNLSDKNESLYF